MSLRIEEMWSRIFVFVITRSAAFCTSWIFFNDFIGNMWYILLQ